MPIIDIIIFVIIISCILTGLVRGFLRTSVQFGISLIAVCVAILLAPTLALLFTDVIHLDAELAHVFANTLTPFCVSSTGGAIDNVALHQFAQVYFGQEYWVGYVDGVESVEFIGKLSFGVAKSVIILLSFFILFSLIKIILGLIAGLIRALNRKRVYGWVARSTGAMVGLIDGILTIFLLFATLYIVVPAVPSLDLIIQNQLPQNPVSAFLYNLIEDFMAGVIQPWSLK